MAAEDEGTPPPRGRHRHSAPNKVLPPFGPAKPAAASAERAAYDSATPSNPTPDFGVWEPWTLEPDEQQLATPQPGPPRPGPGSGPVPRPGQPGELVGAGRGIRPAPDRQAAGAPVAKNRPDTLPSWRSAPGSFGTAAKQVPAAHPAETAGSEAQPGRAAWGLERFLDVRFWPLAIVLTIQAALSLRLVWSATAFLDEGEYLTVGRLELAHFLHHAPMPDVATYFSGSPVVYPPLAAIADDIGGLAGARLLSLVFMLIATIALHGVTRRLLSSRPAAFYATALFAWLGSAEFLGAFATYDAMALMLLAVATWLGVRAIDADYGLRYALLCAGGLAIALADAAKYASALFNPVVIIVVLLAAWRADGRRTALDAGGAMLLVAAVPLTVGYDLGGRSYGAGITSTTLTRTEGTDSVRAVLGLSAHATGVIAVLAVLGAIVITARRPGWATVLLAWVLAGAEFLAPAEQARIHTLTSLFKHVGYGAWFACVIGGYVLAELPGLLARLSRTARAAGGAVRPRWTLVLGASVAVMVVLGAGANDITVANGQYGDWADSRAMIAELNKLVRPSGYYLVEDPSVVTYYLGSKVPFSHVLPTFTSFSYTDPQTHQVLTSYSGFADSIKRGYFNDIVLAFGDTFGQDQAIVQDIATDHDYRLIDVIGYRTSYGPSHYEIWQRVPKPSRTVHAKRRSGSHRA